MFEAVGHAVSRLIRIRYGSMLLPRGLKRGAWVELGVSDIALLTRASVAGTRRATRSSPDDRDAAVEATSGQSPVTAGVVKRASNLKPKPEVSVAKQVFIGGDALQRQRQELKRSGGRRSSGDASRGGSRRG